MRLIAWSAGVVLATQSLVNAQFASDRPLTPQPATTPAAKPPTELEMFPPYSGYSGPWPVTPRQPAVVDPSAGRVAPAPASAGRVSPIPTTIDPNKTEVHPWSIKPTDGEWVVLVKAYSGPNSRTMAEKFVQDIRRQKVGGYLFERNAVERKAELAQIEAIRQKELARNQPFLQASAQAKKEADAKGFTFIEEKHTIKVPKPYRETEEQWAVVIGGWKTADEARAGLEIIRGTVDSAGRVVKAPALTPPADTTLLDTISLGGSQDKKGEDWKSAHNYANPYKTALVVPNPSIAKQKSDEKGLLEYFVVELNQENPYSLLKNRKPWTLIVRSFSVPGRIVGKGSEGTIFDRIMGNKNIHDVTAEEAVRFTAALRDEKFVGALNKTINAPAKFDAYCLHHRTGSIVTVGEFNSVDDPELLRMQQILSGITFKMMKTENQALKGRDGRDDVQRLFDSVSPFPVPVPAPRPLAAK